MNEEKSGAAPYRKPELTTYGRVLTLTQGTSRKNGDLASTGKRNS